MNIRKLVQEEVKKQLEAIEESMFTVGANGLEPIGGEPELYPNSRYFMGASSDPEAINIINVSGGLITYLRYPYKREQRIEYDIAKNLVQTGMENRKDVLKRYDEYNGISYKDYLNYIDNKPLNNIDWDRYRYYEAVEVRWLGTTRDLEKLHREAGIGRKEAVEANDFWYIAEFFGGGVYGKSDGSYGIDRPTEADIKDLRKLEKEGLIEILKIRE